MTEKVNGISDRLPLLTKKLSHFFLAKGGIKLSPSVKQVPLSPFPRKRAPRRLLRGGTSRSRSAGAFPNYATRFRGGALRHAKFPKTSYKVQLLDTLKHGRCVFWEPAKGKPFVGRGATEHILPDAQIFVRLKYVSVGTSGRRRGLIFLSKKVLNFFFTLFNFFPITLSSSKCL